MVDISAIGGALSSLTAAMDITKGLISQRDAAAFRESLIGLQQSIIQAQISAIEAREAHAAQIDRICEIEKEIADLKTWNTEKQGYELKTIGSGAFVYMLKPDMRGSEPAHWLCQHCYENGKKMIMQSQGRTPDKSQSIYKCPSCKSSIYVHWNTKPEWS